MSFPSKAKPGMDMGRSAGLRAARAELDLFGPGRGRDFRRVRAGQARGPEGDRHVVAFLKAGDAADKARDHRTLPA